MVASADTGPSAEAQGWCVLNGAAAINDLMDAGVYTWAASQRCSAVGLKMSGPVKCEIDVATAAESVNRMVNVILRAVEECGQVKQDACGMAAGKLTAHFSGVAAASGGVVQECPNPLQKQQNLVMRDHIRENGAGLPLNDPNWFEGEQATCAVDIKDSLNQVFEASIAISKAGKNCGKDGKCAYDAIEIISAFAGLAKYLMGTIGHCTHGALPVKDFPLTCSENIAGLTRSIMGFIADTDELQQACGLKPGFITPDSDGPKEIILVPQARLYNAKHSKDCEGDDCPRSTFFNGYSKVLTALFPVTAAVGFFAGLRLSRRSYLGHTQLREMELVEPYCDSDLQPMLAA